MWPPGSEVYIGESVFLHCRMASNSSFGWTYLWYRDTPHTASTPNLRHSVSGDSYSITAVKEEDAGSYWCKAEQPESNVTAEGQVELKVSEEAPPSLTLTPNTRHIFKGENLSVQCPTSPTGWELKHLPAVHPNSTTVNQRTPCPPPGGAVCTEKSGVWLLTASSGSSGLYWCEGAGGRSNAVNITVTYGSILLKTPALPVPEGGEVVLFCQFRTENQTQATFFRDGIEIGTFNSSSLDGAVTLTIGEVKITDEGSYKCSCSDRKMESPESWLSVSPDRGSWKWFAVSSIIVLLFLIPLIVWIIYRKRQQMVFCRSCWPLTKGVVPSVPLPETKQDVTEVQWDLSWMEMTTLMDKQIYPGS
ncbi:Peroxidasin-like [Oryzias melastigma]|uniref:Peroxidasin-like n=1 Tax=Oryzias melastigma TaxID=30732 RepID=A0A834FFL3_ORYME|nr:Peroxidasin-like [Oryzias melastigma]